MWLICLKPRGNRPPQGAAHVADFSGAWERIMLVGDVVPYMGVHIPDDHPSAPAAQAMSVHMAGYVSKRDHEVMSAEVATAKLEAMRGPSPETVDQIAELTALALRRGWKLDEILGTGAGGLPGPEGGRSPIVGLTLVELTLAVPPPDWQQLREAGKPPWMSGGWVPPALGWVPPAWPEGRAENPSAEQPKPPAAPPAQELQPIGDTRPPAPAPTQEPGDQEPSKPIGVAPTDDASEAEVVLSEYPAEHLPQVAQIVREMARESGKQPHPNAINHVLKKLEPRPPTPSTAQVAAILTLNN